jgi:enoyl-CoA hydratase/carnithine racemase
MNPRDFKEINFYIVNRHIGTIVLNRPDKGNAITPSMAQEIIKCLKEFEENADIRVVVLTGSGKYFCTGMDLGAQNQQAMQESLNSGNAGLHNII